MALEKDRSRDEDTVNMALVSLLDPITICSGISQLGARQNLSWLLTRQSFQLGPAHKPVCESSYAPMNWAKPSTMWHIAVWLARGC
ncbi:hypothetical protein B0J18DRAFT_424956 [Chaetomium sp. MPI-SDFR-AT-0129]|nr:hypothetical protein B0J18DRAFT_424956 [Chaetomium sp. MPI-SDFR-AT-0129]